LKKNALVRRPGARCVEAAVEAVIQDFFSEFSEERSAALLDPPRTGLDEKVAAALAAHGPAHIFYLSCHPGTLVRDLSRILGGRRYRVKEIACFDMFPRTQHLEALAWLERSGDSKAPA
jgi:23S rRNA (uracil1939-C5)-methyltransferase